MAQGYLIDLILRVSEGRRERKRERSQISRSGIFRHRKILGFYIIADARPLTAWSNLLFTEYRPAEYLYGFIFC